MAVLAGDVLLTLAFRALAGEPAAVSLLGETLIDIVEGQAADLAFEGRRRVSPAQCVEMAMAKTGALLGTSCALGAMFSGAGREQTDGLALFGRRMGLAFQHVDDLLGIWGDPAVTGKPVCSDLRSRKKSLPVAWALNSDTDAGRALAAFYVGDGPLPESALPLAAELVEAAGGREHSRAQADDLLARAVNGLHSMNLDPAATAPLVALAHLLAARDH
jgi:geranylgeranyl diphosphate synthase type I